MYVEQDDIATTHDNARGLVLVQLHDTTRYYGMEWTSSIFLEARWNNTKAEKHLKASNGVKDRSGQVKLYLRCALRSTEMAVGSRNEILGGSVSVVQRMQQAQHNAFKK